MNKLMNIRIKEDALKQLAAIAHALEVPYSQIVREAIREKTERLMRDDPRVKEALSTQQK